MPYIIRAIILWLLLMLVETLHGIARRILLEPIVGDLTARQIAVFTGSALIFGIVFVMIPWLREAVTRQLLLIGALWVFLTLVFEVAIGRFALDLTWDRILQDYDIGRGGLMPIGLLVMFLAPLITAVLRARYRGEVL